MKKYKFIISYPDTPKKEYKYNTVAYEKRRKIKEKLAETLQKLEMEKINKEVYE